MAQADTAARGAGTPPPTFDSLDPRTGEVVGTYPVHDAAEVAAAVQRARPAAQWWAELDFGERRTRLAAFRRLLVRRLDELAGVISSETGKPFDDARIEMVLVIDHLEWAARNAAKVLGRRRVSPGLLMSNHAASLTHRPFGVVGVIGPWNFPAHTPMGSISYALAAGNAVVFKPSELTPGIAVALAGALAEAVPEQPLLQVVTGFGATGEELCRAGADKIAFTGSTGTAKRVMATCAESLTPVLIECGGKDVLIVDEDANLDAAADAAVWGGMWNAGQTCVGVERVYVLDSVAQPFLDRLKARAAKVRVGADPSANYGPMTLPAQADLVRDHVTDALARGARPVVGGPDSIRPPLVEPIVLADVPEDCDAITKETFGPMLTVNRVRDRDEVVRLANATAYGLSAAVFSKARGEQIAARLRCGMVSINGVLAFAAVPALPFGGVGDSGFGRIHGADGLREFARSQAVTRMRFPPPLPIMSFRRTRMSMAALLAAVRVWHRLR